MDFLDKIKSVVKSAESRRDDVGPPSESYTLSKKDVYRYRKQYGVNLGSWFTLERWIAEAPYAGVDGSSELDVAQQAPDAKARLEHHWDTWIVESDWDWIRDRGFNTVRLPIGYYHVCGLDPSLIEGTDFANYYDVYSGAWSRILAAIERAAHHGIGVLVDLHAAPGAQNKYDHSGTPGGHCNFWTPSNTAATVRVLQALALALHPIPNVVGLQLMNEPDNNNGLQSWYESTIASIRGVLSAAYANNSRDDLPPATEFPIFIDDARDPSWYSQWVGRRDDFVIMDRHIYRCFTSQDSHKSGEEHAAGIRASTHGELQRFSDIAHGNVIVGEWSAGLGSEGMPKGSNAGEQDRQRRVFVQAQREVFNRTCAGQFFWCYKKGQGWDAGWSARDASLAAILPEWVGGPAVQLRGDDERESAMEKARNAHHEYWIQHGCKHNELWRFEDGYRQGWEDAKLFAPSRLGYRHRWLHVRTQEHVKQKGTSANVWEFTHGFEQGFDTASQG